MNQSSNGFNKDELNTDLLFKKLQKVLAHTEELEKVLLDLDNIILKSFNEKSPTGIFAYPNRKLRDLQILLDNIFKKYEK